MMSMVLDKTICHFAQIKKYYYYVLLYYILSLALSGTHVNSLRHHLVLKQDFRTHISVSSFGYNLLGRLEMMVQNLTLTPDPGEEEDRPFYGFVIVKSNQARIDYGPKITRRTYEQEPCILEDPRVHLFPDLMVLSFMPQEQKVLINCAGNTSEFPKITSLSYDPRQKGSRDHSSYHHQYNKRETSDLVGGKGIVKPISAMLNESSDGGVPERRKSKYSQYFHPCPDSPLSLPLEVTTDSRDRRLYSMNYSFLISDAHQEGKYYISFQNCRGYHPVRLDDDDTYKSPSYREKQRTRTSTQFDLDALIFETNYPGNYLSAGNMPLPQMYLMMSVMFFLSGCIWINFIGRQKENKLKIHNLMTVLVFAKAASLLFHGINYHYIALDGQPVVTWAYLYYATRAVKGSLFFITLALIGSGWTFIKHILSQRDKTMILVIVALQIIAHIAEIILDESTEGEKALEFWWQIFSLIDLFSCIFILLPITWSVRHLENASRTDGKAAINLKKLELFKSFYIVSTIYIYVTRIMTFIFLSMLSYKYSWLAELFAEFATLIYFVVTGYYFQPMPSNSYLLLSVDNNADMEEDILFSVDAHEMNGLQMDDKPDSSSTDRHNLLNEGSHSRTKRRTVEEMV